MLCCWNRKLDCESRSLLLPRALWSGGSGFAAQGSGRALAPVHLVAPSLCPEESGPGLCFLPRNFPGWPWNPACSEADKERRSSSTHTPTHTGPMTGPLQPPSQRLPDRPTKPKTLNLTSHSAANPIAAYLQAANWLERDCTSRQPLVFVALPPLPWMLDGRCGVSVELVLGSVDTVECLGYQRRLAVFSKL
jgi:hypothetical protein